MNEGKNLEFYLRNKETYNEGQIILNELLEFFIKNKIYWLDFAARNIIISAKEIYIVDYEKGFAKRNIKVKEYLRSHVYEEYCVFLFPKDRKYSIDEVLNLKNENNKRFSLNQIKCNRCCELAKMLGYSHKISKKEYLNILKKIIVAQEPKIINEKYYFPCVELDKMLKNKDKKAALEKYCEKIIDLYDRANNELTYNKRNV